MRTDLTMECSLSPRSFYHLVGVLCTMYSVFRNLQSVFSTMYSVFNTSFSVFSTLYSELCILCFVLCTLYWLPHTTNITPSPPTSLPRLCQKGETIILYGVEWAGLVVIFLFVRVPKEAFTWRAPTRDERELCSRGPRLPDSHASLVPRKVS